MKKRYAAGCAVGALSLVAVAAQVFDEPKTRHEVLLEQAREQADRYIAEFEAAKAAEQTKMDAMTPEELDAYMVEKTEVLREFEAQQRDHERQLKIHEAIMRSGMRGYDI